MELSSDSGGLRNIDVTTSSMDIVQLNNLVVSMRTTVKKCKVHIIRKLVHQIHKLQAKKGNEAQVAANKRKAERLIKEIEVLKQLNIDRISKYSLANTSSLDELGKQSDPESRVMLRIACHKIMSDRVKAWREKHDDWKALAAFLLYKNTGRRFKKKKITSPEKNKVALEGTDTKDKESKLKKANRVGLPSQVNNENKRKKLGSHSKEKELQDIKQTNETVHLLKVKSDSQQSCEVDSESNPSEGNSNFSKQKTKILKKHNTSVHSNKLSTSDETSSESDISLASSLCEKEKNLEQQNQEHISSDHEAVVKKINLGDLSDDAHELDFLFRRPSPEENISSEVNSGKESTSSDIKKKDPFFCDSGSDRDDEAREDTDAEQSDGEGHSDVDDEEDVYKRVPLESTFIRTLAGGFKCENHSQGQNQFRGQGHKRDGSSIRRGSSCNKNERVLHQGRGRPDKMGASKRERREFKESRGRLKQSRDGIKQERVGRKQERGVYKQERGTMKRNNVGKEGSKHGPSYQAQKRSASESAESLHPSWAASKIRKQQQSLIGAFQGKKITFDDSE